MTAFPERTEVVAYVAILMLYIENIRLSEFSIYKNDLVSFIIYSSSYIITGLVVISMLFFINDASVFYALTLVYVAGLFIRLLGKFIHAKKMNDQARYQDVITILKMLAKFLGVTLILVIVCAIIFDLAYWLLGNT